MTTYTMRGRALAIIAGLAFATGGLTILLDKDLTRPLQWPSSQWLTILTVFGTIAAGHLMVEAWRTKGGWLSAIGFGVLFLSGTGLVVYNSVGRQAEAAGTTTLSVEDTNKKIVEKSADLEAAKARKAYADAQVQKTMTGSYCGRGCKDWKQNAKDVAIVISQLEAEIAALGPQKPVNAQAAAMADIALLFHVPATKDQVIAALMLLVPFFKTLFFEIGSIVSLGFAFRTKPEAVAKKLRQVQLARAERSDPAPSTLGRPSAEIVPLPRPNSSPNGSGPRPGTRIPSRKAEVLADIVARIESGERFASQEELRSALAERFGKIGKSTLSEWLDELDRAIVRTPVGRQKSIG